MTINLVNRVGPEQAHRLLEQSFAQYQADRSVVEPGPRRRAGTAGCSTRSRPNSAGTTRPILEYARLRGADQPAGARPGPRVAAAAQAGGQRRADRAAPRRHHHDHPRPPGRAGRRAGSRPRQRRPAAVGADRKPLGRKDFLGRLLRRLGAGGVDDAAQAGRAPPAAGAPRSGFGAAFGGRGTVDPAAAAAAAARRGRDHRSRSWRRCATKMRRHPAHANPTGRPESGSPSAICASNAKTRAAEEGRRCHQLVGPHLRPDRRVAHRTRLHPAAPTAIRK